jgi:hypothetical protein
MRLLFNVEDTWPPDARLMAVPWRIEDRMIGDVERFRAEFQTAGLSKREFLHERDVKLEERVGAQNIATRVSIRVDGRHGEGISSSACQAAAAWVRGDVEPATHISNNERWPETFGRCEPAPVFAMSPLIVGVKGRPDLSALTADRFHPPTVYFSHRESAPRRGLPGPKGRA